ncbi:MAG: hypothetical protein PHF41_07580 [Massilibacteroides sp.]|nr:hypothetical protein [Massilibacteroides sp.]
MRHISPIGTKGESLMPPNEESIVDGIHFTDCGFQQYAKTVLPLLRKIIDKKK